MADSPSPEIIAEEAPDAVAFNVEFPVSLISASELPEIPIFRFSAFMLKHASLAPLRPMPAVQKCAAALMDEDPEISTCNLSPLMSKCRITDAPDAMIEKEAASNLSALASVDAPDSLMQLSSCA